MDITTTGGEVLASSDNQPTADPSAISHKTGKPRTTRTGRLTPDMALEILEAAVLKCQEAGISIGTSPYFNAGTRCVVIVVESCTIDDAKHLQLLGATSGK
jgi:hypothetical protein